MEALETYSPETYTPQPEIKKEPELKEVNIVFPEKIKSHDEWRSELTTTQKTEKGDNFNFYTEYVFTEFLKGCGFNAKQTKDHEEVPGGGDTKIWLASHGRYLYFDTKNWPNIDVEHVWETKYSVDVRMGRNFVLKIASGHHESQEKLFDVILSIERELETGKNMTMIEKSAQTTH